jgi:hypothetical protein
MPTQSRPSRQVALSPAAVLKRVNRRLARDLEVLRKNRGGPYMERYGDWLRIDLNHNSLIGSTDDLEAFARDLGVLQAWERLATEKEMKA